MRIEVMLIAKNSGTDTTSVSTMIDLDTRKPGWKHGLVRTVAEHASAGAEHLREHIVTDDVPLLLEPPMLESSTFEPAAFVRAPTAFVPLAQLVPSASAPRLT